MAAIAVSSGASSASIDDRIAWSIIPWRKAFKFVNRLQMRIAKATREGRKGKVKALQRLLTHSFYAKALAVKRVTENTGGKTPGVDGVIWKTLVKKIQAVRALKRRGYQPQPLRRTYIPKKGNAVKLRPLGIPTMIDRAMQALHLLALEPVAEILADRNSYGFRPKRSCADAIEQCFIVLSRRVSAPYILEGDIRTCFDIISHPWLENNITTDTVILHKWLNSGYMEKGVFHHTKKGTPQGGIISPTVANMALDGLGTLIKSISKQPDKVNFVRYADDFIVTGNSREILENKIKPAIKIFLAERGLELSQEKTKITHINDGFDFLGFNIRRYGRKFFIKPAKKSVLSFLKDIRALIKQNIATKTEILIQKLNAHIRGWANYYRHVVSKRIFSYIDHCINHAIIRWINRRHPNKSAQWKRKKYFRSHGHDNWIFFAKIRNKEGEWINLNLFKASSVKIERHIKIKCEATPFDPNYKDYFEKRKTRHTKIKF